MCTGEKHRARGKSDSCNLEDVNGLVDDSPRNPPCRRYTTTTPDRLPGGVNYIREQCSRRDWRDLGGKTIKQTNW